MSNETARELISVANELLNRARSAIESEEKCFVFQYPLERCPDAILKKWIKEHDEQLVHLSATIQIQNELKTRERLHIKIEGVK